MMPAVILTTNSILRRDSCPSLKVISAEPRTRSAWRHIWFDEQNIEQIRRRERSEPGDDAAAYGDSSQKHTRRSQ